VAPQTASTAQGSAVPFAPSVLHGAEPVTTTCTPTGGAVFPIGTTSVSCTATDARQRTASCAFNVVVLPAPRLTLTRFLAFGDSLTAGEDGSTALTTGSGEPHRLLAPTVILFGREYPTVLQRLLAGRFSNDRPVVFNAGCPAELAGGKSPCASGGTLARFGTLISSGQFDVVLLMEGTNDIYGGTGGNPLGIPPAIANLRRMIRDARSRGLRVFLATVPPANPAAVPRGAERYQAIPLLNAEIRQLAIAEGVTPVDVFNAFNNNFAYLAPDGTHPNAEGYELIATTFYEVLRNELQASTPVGLSFGREKQRTASP
jgi:lysophospholipase L1-like esterase